MYLMDKRSSAILIKMENKKINKVKHASPSGVGGKKRIAS